MLDEAKAEANAAPTPRIEGQRRRRRLMGLGSAIEARGTIISNHPQFPYTLIPYTPR
jgi:hypothetical protein